jgi:hypothetical protein
VSLIDAGGDIFVCVCNPSLSWFCLLVGEMRGEGVNINVICTFFESWTGGDGSKFVVSVVVELWELLAMEMMY